MSKMALHRLRKEFVALRKQPVANIEACPRESNILEWHYVIKGPADSPYADGYYHGKLKFPAEYPYKPPSILMCTPSGRFAVNKRICLSMSDFHPETWNPMWSVSSILAGLLSFMLEDHATYGSIVTTVDQKHKFAKNSLDFNMKSAIFLECFPHYKATYKQLSEVRRQAQVEREEKGKKKKEQAAVAAKVELQGGGRKSEDLWDKMVISIIVALLVFVFSFLYS